MNYFIMFEIAEKVINNMIFNLIIHHCNAMMSSFIMEFNRTSKNFNFNYIWTNI